MSSMMGMVLKEDTNALIDEFSNGMDTTEEDTIDLMRYFEQAEAALDDMERMAKLQHDLGGDMDEMPLLQEEGTEADLDQRRAFSLLVKQDNPTSMTLTVSEQQYPKLS